MESQATAPSQPFDVIWRLANGATISRCLQVMAELGVADALGDGSLTADELASRCGADADALDRALRLLASEGVFEHDGGEFRNSPASELLRAEHPMGMWSFSRMMGLPIFTGAFVNLERSIRTGRAAAEAVDPRGLWAYFADHPDEAAIFDHTMAAKSAPNTAAIVDAYDFAQFTTIADIGGSRGHLLRAVLESAPGARGVLFDLPVVIDAVESEHERIELQAGSFMVDPLPAADGYILMNVLHDWPDEDCVKIMQAVRRAAEPGAKVLVIETLIPEDGVDLIGQYADMIMLAMHAGKERTLSQLADIVGRAGFGGATVHETQGLVSIIEASAV